MLLPWQNFLLLHMRNVGLSQLQLTGKKLKVHECKCRPIWFSLPHIIFSWIFLRSKAKNNSMETSGIKLSILSGALYVGFGYLFHGVHDYTGFSQVPWVSFVEYIMNQPKIRHPTIGDQSKFMGNPHPLFLMTSKLINKVIPCWWWNKDMPDTQG
jgi:hypothetical protein